MSLTAKLLHSGGHRETGSTNRETSRHWLATVCFLLVTGLGLTSNAGATVIQYEFENYRLTWHESPPPPWIDPEPASSTLSFKVNTDTASIYDWSLSFFGNNYRTVRGDSRNWFRWDYLGSSWAQPTWVGQGAVYLEGPIPLTMVILESWIADDSGEDASLGQAMADIHMMRTSITTLEEKYPDTVRYHGRETGRPTKIILNQVPEPSTLALLGLGLVGLGVKRRLKQ